MNVLFFGDSFTEASNNKFDGFVEKMKLHQKGFTYKNFGVSGTTLAPYSLYPVGDNDLLYLLMTNSEDVEKAAVIFLEYGINDFASVAINYMQYLDVAVAFTKCIDYITQLNPRCKIIYLIPSSDKKILELIAKSQKQYLEKDYFSIWNTLTFDTQWFVKCFSNFIDTINNKVEVIEMIPNKEFMSECICEDGIHPNDEGYKVIAEHILKQLKLNDEYNN